MNTDKELLLKQNELKEAITKGGDSTIPAYFFNRTGDALKRILRLSNRPPWPVNAGVMAIALFLPGLFVAILTGEVREWGSTHWFYISLWWAGFLSPVVAHLNVTNNVLPTIRDHIVDSIQDANDLDRFSAWTRSLWSLRKWMLANVLIGAPYLIIIVAAESLGLGEFIGYGMLTMNILLALLFVSPF